jgi:virulence-associated protein VapD
LVAFQQIVEEKFKMSDEDVSDVEFGNSSDSEDELLRVITWDLKDAPPKIHRKGKGLVLAQGYEKMQASAVISQQPTTFANCLIDVQNVCRIYPEWQSTIRDIRILIHEERSDITDIIKMEEMDDDNNSNQEEEEEIVLDEEEMQEEEQ